MLIKYIHYCITCRTKTNNAIKNIMKHLRSLNKIEKVMDFVRSMSKLPTTSALFNNSIGTSLLPEWNAMNIYPLCDPLQKSQ